MGPHKRFQQARNSQPTRVTAQQIADRLGVTHNAVRHMERGYSETLLKKAIKEFAPEWNLSESWFYEETPPPALRESKAQYNSPSKIDLPIYVGIIRANKCVWDLSTGPSKRSIRAAFLSAPPEDYFQIIVGGSTYSPRIHHGSIILIRRTTLFPESALVLAHPKDSSQAVIGVFHLDPAATTPGFDTFSMDDRIIGQVEYIHHPTESGPNIEFSDGDAIRASRSQALYQTK